MFILQATHNVEGVAQLTGAVGYAGQTAINPDNGDIWAKLDGGWKKIAGGDGKPVPIAGAVPASVTVKSADGGVSRELPVNGGVVTLAATDAIVSNGAQITLQKADGGVAKGSAGLNSPAAAVVAAGVVTAIKASA